MDDQIELIESLREKISELEDEKQQLIDTINHIKNLYSDFDNEINKSLKCISKIL